MGTVSVLTARDLRNQAGRLFSDAEQGKISMLTKHGRPAALAVPFDTALLEQGVHRFLAVRLYAEQLVTLSQAAKLAGLPIEDFLDILSIADVDVVDYPAGELQGEVAALQ